MKSRSVYRKYVLQMSGFIGIGLAFIMSVNVIVDPYKVFRLVNIRSLDEKKSKLTSRLAKGEAFMREDFEILLLGDSRTLRGIDPRHASWESSRVYNCAVPGASLNEMQRIIKLAVQQKHGSLQRIVMGVIPEFIDEPSDGVPSQFQLSRFNPATFLPYYYTDHLLSRNTFRVSFSTLLDAVTTPVGLAYTRDGHRTHESQAHELSQSDWKRRFTRYAKRTLGTPTTHGSKVTKATQASLRNTIRLCQENNVQLTFVLIPTHGTLMEIIHARGKWPVVEDSKRVLTAMVFDENARNPNRPPCHVWDFFNYDFYSTERVETLVVDSNGGQIQGPLDWFWEFSHFKGALGNLIIDRIQGQYPSHLPEIGMLLTPDGIEPWLARIRENRRRYRESESENAAWIDYMAARYGANRG